MALMRLAGIVLAVGLALPSVGAQQAVQRWRLVEVWRSGGDPAHALSFDDAIAMQLAPNGHLLVLVGGGQPALVSIDNTGRPVRTIGGGAAPPLLEHPNGFVQFPDGRIVINDPQVGRFSVVSEAGRFLRTIEYQPWGYTRRWLGFAGPGGALFEPVADAGRLIWRRWSSDFAASQLLPQSGCDTSLAAAAPEASFQLDGPLRHVVVAVPLLQPAIASVRGPDGTSWTGVGPDYRRIIRTPWLECVDTAEVILSGEPLRVPDDVRQAEQARILGLAAEAGALRRPDVDRIPTVFPRFHTLHLDPRGRLWVERRLSPTTRAFTVYATNGSRLAEIPRLPVAIDTTRPVTFSDNHLFAFTTDESGWVWLVALRIERVA